jgi:hypothetical protein
MSPIVEVFARVRAMIMISECAQRQRPSRHSLKQEYIVLRRFMTALAFICHASVALAQSVVGPPSPVVGDIATVGGTGANSATANTVLAAPDGSPGAPTKRALVAADYPLAAVKANNLSDRASAATARTNPGFTNAAGDDVMNASGQHFASGCVAIEAFGGVGNGSTDTLAAWNAAVSSFRTKDICIKFGVGTYVFSNTASATPSGTAHIRIFGMGKSVTHLLWNVNVAGMILTTGNEMTVEVDGLDFETGSFNTNTALAVNSSDCSGSKYSSHFNDLSFRGQGSYLPSSYWTNDLLINNLSDVSATDVDFFGNRGNHTTGLTYQSSNPKTCVAIVLNVTHANFINDKIGFLYGKAAQGVTISQSNFANGLTGINVPVGSIGTAQLSVSDSQFNTTNDQILIKGDLVGCQIMNNVFTVPASPWNGIYINNASANWFTILGNIFENTKTTGGDGIQVNANGASNVGTITGNGFYNLGFGVGLQAGSRHWTVASNSYNHVTTNVSNSGVSNLVGVATP